MILSVEKNLQSLLDELKMTILCHHVVVELNIKRLAPVLKQASAIVAVTVNAWIAEILVVELTAKFLNFFVFFVLV